MIFSEEYHQVFNEDNNEDFGFYIFFLQNNKNIFYYILFVC